MADWQTLARRAARQEGIPANLFIGLVRQESGGQRDVISRAGAIGRTQLMPGTARGLGVDPRNPWQNLLGGAKYLRQQLDAFGGNVDKALAAYNAGPGAVQKYGGVPPYAETRNYVRSVKALAGRIGPVPSRGRATAVPQVSSLGNPAAPAGLSIGPDAGGGVDVSALLAELQQSRRGQGPPSAGIQAPSFAAGPTLPQGYQAPVSSGGPAPRQDIGSLLSLVRTQGGGEVPAASGAVSDAGGPQTPSKVSAGFRVPRGASKGVATFEGKPVAAWIKPALQYARQHGWKGTVSSGYRSFGEQKRIYDSGVRPAAVPGTSNHEGTAFPRGAVDVSDAQQLAAILQNSPYRRRLIYAGAKDPVHFSHPHGGHY